MIQFGSAVFKVINMIGKKAVIGDDLGYKLLPRWIDRTHFETVVECLKREATDVTNLEDFYTLNINYLSNRFELGGNLEF